MVSAHRQARRRCRGIHARRCRRCSRPAERSPKRREGRDDYHRQGRRRKPGATKTASGIVIKHTKEGTGASPAATDEVKVHYEGRLIDGKVFDSSIARGEPAMFPLNGVIPCWTEGVQTMKVGGKATARVPRESRVRRAAHRRAFRPGRRWCSTSSFSTPSRRRRNNEPVNFMNDRRGGESFRAFFMSAVLPKSSPR